MVERNTTTQGFPCKLCSDGPKQNVCVANCIGCKDHFCLVHLIQHRQELSNEFDRLTKQYVDINEKFNVGIDINQHLEYIDKWQAEITDLVHQHTEHTKNYIRSVFDSFISDLKSQYTMYKKEIDLKKKLNLFNEDILRNLSQQITQFNNEIKMKNELLHNINVQELNKITDKYRVQSNTMHIRKNLLRWNYLRDIKLDSTYGYMAADNQYIYLGWKNRITIYNVDGTKYSETNLKSFKQYGELCDLLWSSTLECFFILCRKSLFVHYSSSKQVELIQDISLVNDDNHYISMATYENTCLLLDKTSISLWKLMNINLIRDREIKVSSILKNPADESICCMRINQQNLVLLIQNKKTCTWHLELYKIPTFQCCHAEISFDYFNQSNLGLFIPFYNNTYLFMNWETKIMRMIGSDDLNEAIDYNAYNACLLGTQRRIIVNYMTCLKVYEF